RLGWSANGDLPVRQNHSNFVNLIRCSQMKSAQDRVRQKSDFMNQFKLIWAVQPRYGKYSYSVFQKLVIYFAHPASTRGAYRDRHGRWKRDAMDAAARARRTRAERTAKPCGPGPPMLGSSCAKQMVRPTTGANKPVPRGEHGVSRKPLRREGRCFGVPVVILCALFLPTLAHKAAG